MSIVAVIDPSYYGRSRLVILDTTAEETELCRFSGAGKESIPHLIEFAAASFVVDEWRLEANGAQGLAAQDPAVVEVCERLGIVLNLVQGGG